MVQKSILDYFPKHLTPRDVQKDALLKLEKNWNRGDIFVVNLPVASGKSCIAVTLSRWLKRAKIITPTKLLVNQYKDEYPVLHVLKSKADYYCSTEAKTLDRKKARSFCSSDINCTGCYNYLKDVRKAYGYPFVLANYFVYFVYRLYQNSANLIVDEAHQTIPTLQEMASRKIWRSELAFPLTLDNTDKIKQYLNSLDKEFYSDLTIRAEKYPKGRYAKLLKKLNKFTKEVNYPGGIRFLFRQDKEILRGEEQYCLKMIPLDIRDEPDFLWPKGHINKMVLMSATISRVDIEQLGLSDKKIIYLEAESPIAAKNRPVIIPEYGKNLSAAQQQTNLPYLAEYIVEKAYDNKDSKGLIHATYNLARLLKPILIRELEDRVIFHDRENKAQQYQLFRDSKSPKILVASGMYEGIDLPYDAGRWQVIAKIPFPNLGEPAIAYKAKVDKDFYAWETIKTVLQACGRICRDPSDYGETFIFDSSFHKLYNNNLDLWPKWFQASILTEY